MLWGLIGPMNPLVLWPFLVFFGRITEGDRHPFLFTKNRKLGCARRSTCIRSVWQRGPRTLYAAAPRSSPAEERQHEAGWSCCAHVGAPARGTRRCSLLPRRPAPPAHPCSSRRSSHPPTLSSAVLPPAPQRWRAQVLFALYVVGCSYLLSILDTHLYPLRCAERRRRALPAPPSRRRCPR